MDLNSGKLRPIDDSDTNLLNKYTQTDLVFQSPLTCYKIAVPNPALAILAKPNGYFDDDLTPSDHFHLTQFLSENYGYEIFGLGESTVCFVRSESFGQEEIRKVIDSIKGLYLNANKQILDRWVDVAKEKRWFLMHNNGV